MITDHLPDAGKMMPTEQDYARDLASDLAIAEAASPGPWTVNDESGSDHFVWGADGVCVGSSWHYRNPRANQVAIASARAALPAAVRRAQAAEAALLDIAVSIENKDSLAYGSAVGAAEVVAARIRAGREKGAPTP